MTVATVVSLVRDMANDEPWEDYLSSGYTAAGATVSLGSPTAWVQGDVLDFAEDGTYEQMRVITTPSTNPVSIKKAHNGTTNANHASGATALKNPRFGTQQIVNAIGHICTTRLWPDVWVASTTTVTPAPTTTNIYDMPADYMDLITVEQVALGSQEDIVYLSAEELLSVPTAIATSNKALRITGWPRTDADATVFYRAKPTTSNMTSAMEPVIAIGTAAYLLRTESMEKADRFDQDDRTARSLRAASALEGQFRDEKQRLRTQLMGQWGGIRKWRR